MRFKLAHLRYFQPRARQRLPLDVSIEPAKCSKGYMRLQSQQTRVVGEYRTDRDLCVGEHAIEPGSRCESVVQTGIASEGTPIERDD